MKAIRNSFKRGFTLIELSLAIGLGMTISAIVLALVDQQLMFLKIIKTQSFVIEEAPMISLYVGKMVGKADRFRIHNSLADALSGERSGSAGNTLLMNFRQPDGTMRAAILAFEERGGRRALNYYLVPTVVTGTPPVPQWSITRKAADVEFMLVEGILRMQLTGTSDEQITYSGTMQQ